MFFFRVPLNEGRPEAAQGEGDGASKALEGQPVVGGAASAASRFGGGSSFGHPSAFLALNSQRL